MDKEFERMISLMPVNGTCLVDTSWITSFCEQRLDERKRIVKREFYERLVDKLSEEIVGGKDISFPRETLNEFGTHIRNNEDYLERLRKDPTLWDYARLGQLPPLIGSMQRLEGLMWVSPSEAYITPEIRKYSQNIINLSVDIMSRPGISRDFGERYGTRSSRKEHKRHDAQIVATALGILLSRPTEVYILTRDSDLMRAIKEIRKMDPGEIRGLCDRYNVPSFGDYLHLFGVIYDVPLNEINKRNQATRRRMAAIPKV